MWNLRELSFEALIPGSTGAAGLLSPSSVSTKYFLESKHTTLLVESTSHSAHVLRKVVFLTGWASQKSSKDENASHHRMANCVVGQNKYLYLLLYSPSNLRCFHITSFILKTLNQYFYIPGMFSFYNWQFKIWYVFLVSFFHDGNDWIISRLPTVINIIMSTQYISSENMIWYV